MFYNGNKGFKSLKPSLNSMFTLCQPVFVYAVRKPYIKCLGHDICIVREI